MIFRLLFISLLTLSLFIESTFLSFPLIILFSVLYFFFFEDVGTCLVIFIISLIFDVSMLNMAGFTAIFLFSVFVILILLEKLFTLHVNMLTIATVIIILVEAYRQYAHYSFLIGPEALLLIGLLFGIFVQKKLQKGGTRYSPEKY